MHVLRLVMLKTRLQDSGNATGLAAKEIAFIANESFGSTEPLEADMVLYDDEETSYGSLDSEATASSLMSTLRQSQLLTFEGEQLLFKRLNFLRFRANAIRMTLDVAKPAKKKLREMERLLAEAASVREGLATASLRLVASIAGKLSKSRDEYEEFFAEGNCILLYAIDKFDYARGYRFSTYLTHAVQRHLYRVINRQRKRAEREFSREPEIMMNEATAKQGVDELAEDEVRDATALFISQIDQKLDDREQFIIRGRFGLDGSGKVQSYGDISKQIGLSKERVRQICQRSLEKLRNLAKPLESTFAPS